MTWRGGLAVAAVSSFREELAPEYCARGVATQHFTVDLGDGVCGSYTKWLVP